MPSLTIRNIPETLMEDLRRLAKQERRSVNAQTIHCLEDGVVTWKDAPEWWNRYRRLGKRSTGVMDWDRTVRS